MKSQINIAELLKDCPSGMELDCTMYDSVTLLNVNDREDITFPIKVLREDGNYIALTKYGQYTYADFAKCIIFPKGKTTWEEFVPPCKFKDGDVAITYMGDIHLCRTEDSSYCACRMPYARLHRFDSTITTGVKFIRLATEKEKQILFDSIKANGYRWSPETKTLEKLTKFKVGDKIKHKDSGIYCTLGEYSEGISAYRTNIGLSLTYKDMEQWELVPNKFDIDTLIPFESRVLVRNGDRDHWRPAIFGGYAKNKDNEIEYYYALGGTCWRNCIPYEGNEHLSTTTNDCDKYYKNW